jgi:hypothetical protein
MIYVPLNKRYRGDDLDKIIENIWRWKIIYNYSELIFPNLTKMLTIFTSRKVTGLF